MFAPWTADLDDAQREAAAHGDGPLVILAGAGTGKTRTLTARVAYLLQSGVPPERILLLTFTRRAADDMLARAASLVGAAPEATTVNGLARSLRGGTFHAVAYQVVSVCAEPLGLKRGFSVLDPSDAAAVMDMLRPEFGLSTSATETTETTEPTGSPGDTSATEANNRVGRTVRVPTANTLVELHSRCVNTGRRLSDVVPLAFPWCQAHLGAISELFRAYEARKRQRAQLDLDDLLVYWLAALRDPQIGPQLTALFDYVLVDEYQDVNSLQVDIVRHLCPGGRGLTVVGDDAQAIYGFRGAHAARIFELAQQFPEAAVVRLVRNFRSRQAVLDVANAARPPAPARPHAEATQPDPGRPHARAAHPAAGKPHAQATGGPLRLVLEATRPGGHRPVLISCHDAASEARALVDRVLEAHERGRRFQDQAVLVRAAHHSDLLELELSARRVPYRKYGGLRFLEAAHVKDFVAAARLLHNPSDDLAWFRILRLHDGIGAATAKGLVKEPPPRPDRAPLAARGPLSRTMEMIGSARSTHGAGRQAECVLETVRPLISARYPSAPARLGDLERLVSAAHGAQAIGQSLPAWLAGLVLDPPVSSGDLAGPPHLDEDFLVISTVHSAKGLEWPVVHLAHLVDGAFPADMALGSSEGLAEERRLFYVAITRARDELYLYTPLRMPHHRFAYDDRHSLAPKSRFLDGAVMDLLDVEEIPARAPTTFTRVPVAAEGGRHRDLVVDLSNLWT